MGLRSLRIVFLVRCEYRDVIVCLIISTFLMRTGPRRLDVDGDDDDDDEVNMAVRRCVL